MLKSKLWDSFRDFAQREIFAQGFDFIVPIEQKGMFLLNELLRERGEEAPGTVLYRRAFDFLKPEELDGKRVALVDDTVVMGRASARSARRLQEAGVRPENLHRFAFMLNDQEAFRSRRQIDGVKICSQLLDDEYYLILPELTELCKRVRPSYPDHLTFTGTLGAGLPAEEMVNVCARAGTLVSYQRPEGRPSLSIHFPSFAPALPAEAADTGMCKMRVDLAEGRQGLSVRFGPQMFPALLARQPGALVDEAHARFAAVLAQADRSRESGRLGQYEAFTLAMRVKLAARFLALTEEAGFTWAGLGVDASELRRYYGHPIAEQLVDIAIEALESRSTRPPSTDPDVHRGGEDLEETTPAMDLHSASGEILETIRNDYLKQNTKQYGRDVFVWRSRGLTVNEIAVRSSYSPLLVSLVVEALNGY